MALDPLELATIVGILIALFLWGPQKIPELARTIARARKEFDSATRQFQSVATSITDGTNPLFAADTYDLTAPAAPKPGVRSAFPQQQQQQQQLAPPLESPPMAKTGDELLIEAARKLGISTQGKTREQIQQEIIAMAKRPIPGDTSSTPPKSEGSTG